MSVAAAYSIRDVRYAFRNVLSGGTVREGINKARNGSTLTQFVELLKSLFSRASEFGDESQVDNSTLQNDYLDIQIEQNTRSIVNAKLTHDAHGVGSYQCSVSFNGSAFEITAPAGSDDASGDSLDIYDPLTDASESVDGISFSKLQKRMLVLHINDQITHKATANYLSNFNLTHIDLRSLIGVNLSQVNFSESVLNEQNVLTILERGGCLHGAALQSAPDVKFNAHGVDKSTALKLLAAGVDRHFVFQAYLASERQRGNSKIGIDGLDVTSMDLSKLNLHEVYLSKDNGQSLYFSSLKDVKKYSDRLFRFQGTLIVGEDHYDVSMLRGRSRVEAIATTQIDALVKGESNFYNLQAQQLQNLLNTSRRREHTMLNMSHAKLPPPLQRLAPEHWQNLTSCLLEASQNATGQNLAQIIRGEFYENIYKKASSNIEYVFSNTKPERLREWREVVLYAQQHPEEKPNGIKYGRYGLIQIDKNSPDPVRSARVYLRYHTAPTQSRLQLLVSSQAGEELLKRIGRVMDNLIDKEFGGDVQRLPIRSFKVFSEDAQVGRSDSAVLYLSKPLHDEDVQKVVTYLNNALRDRMVDIKVVGASTMGQSLIQGVTVPDKALQIKVTGKGTTSNGKLVANILSMAYLQASLGKIGYISQETLTQRAMFYANEIWNELHGQDAARIPFVTED